MTECTQFCNPLKYTAEKVIHFRCQGLNRLFGSPNCQACGLVNISTISRMPQTTEHLSLGSPSQDVSADASGSQEHPNRTVCGAEAGGGWRAAGCAVRRGGFRQPLWPGPGPLEEPQIEPELSLLSGNQGMTVPAPINHEDNTLSKRASSSHVQPIIWMPFTYSFLCWVLLIRQLLF